VRGGSGTHFGHGGVTRTNGFDGSRLGQATAGRSVLVSYKRVKMMRGRALMGRSAKVANSRFPHREGPLRVVDSTDRCNTLHACRGGRSVADVELPHFAGHALTLSRWLRRLNMRGESIFQRAVRMDGSGQRSQSDGA